MHHTVREVVDSIGKGATWTTRAGGYEGLIRAISKCPESESSAAPYIGTKGVST